MFLLVQYAGLLPQDATDVLTSFIAYLRAVRVKYKLNRLEKRRAVMRQNYPDVRLTINGTFA